MDGDCYHPLFELVPTYERDESGYLTEVRNFIFSSRSYGNSTRIAGKCFNHKLKDSSIYIMYITTNDAISKNQDEHSIEIWICKNRGANRFLCSTKETPVISGKFICHFLSFSYIFATSQIVLIFSSLFVQSN